ncbi:MAG: hypothetical protein ACXACP_10210 [Candidatus Hodarchaeales archaeon]|jgi:hypothetical protein
MVFSKFHLNFVWRCFLVVLFLMMTSLNSIPVMNLQDERILHQPVPYEIHSSIDIAGNVEAPTIYKKLTSNGGPTITNIRCYTEQGGDPIGDGVWSHDTDPFLVWEVSIDVSDILGYSWSITGTPDTSVDTTEQSVALFSLSEGITYFSVRACNTTNYWGPTAQFSLAIDAQSDIVTISSSSHPIESTWTSNSTATFNWLEPSSTSPIAGYSYVFDQVASTQSDAALETIEHTITYSNISEGIWYFHLRVVDEAGNVGPVDHYSIMVDTSLPIVTNIQCYTEQGGDPISDGVWSQDSDPFLVWEVSTDVSGILGYSWSVTGTPDTSIDTTEQSVALSSLPEGITQFSVRAYDNANHWGPVTQFSLAIDTQSDSVNITSSSHPMESLLYENQTVVFNWLEPSSTSPIAGYSYVFDQVTSTQSDATLETIEHTITYSNISEGIWYFHLRAVDEAGNVGPVDHYTIKIGSTTTTTPATSTTTTPSDTSSSPNISAFEIIGVIIGCIYLGWKKKFKN